MTKFQEKLDHYKKQGAIIVAPNLDNICDMVMPVGTHIQADARKDFKKNTDFYFHKISKKWMFTYSFLQRMAQAAGIEFDPVQTREIEASRNAVKYQALGKVLEGNGMHRIYPTTGDMDLGIIEDEIRLQHHGKEDAERCIKRDILMKRKNKCKLVEANAKGRCIRAILNLPYGYDSNLKETIIEAVKGGFYVVKFTWNLNNSDIKSLFLENARSAMSSVYSGNNAAQPQPQITAPEAGLPVPEEEIMDAITESIEPVTDDKTKEWLEYAEYYSKTNPSKYYEILGKHGFESADEVTGKEVRRAICKAWIQEIGKYKPAI
jgi:hypothetical protein